MKKIDTDLIIVGTGVAGLTCALNADKDIKIVLITKKDMEDSNSYLAQGGISIRQCEEDREVFIEDTLKAGHHENIKEAVEILADESEDALDFLIKEDVPFNKIDGKIAFTREGGHSIKRIAYSDDVIGKNMMDSLIKDVKTRENIKIMTNCEVEDLLVDEKSCIGVYAKTNDEKYLIYAKNTVLATGGIGGIYKNTTNFPHIKGDGIALAIKHDVKLRDMSYVQIHPTALYEGKEGRRFLISESVRGEGAVLLNHNKERFTDELKPRDIVSKAILKEMEKDNANFEYLNMQTVDKDIATRYPNIYDYLLNINIDAKKDLVPIVPAAHYTMGGIEVDLDGKTSLDNLYAVGEVSSTGVHGKNRLASNSLLESVVFGTRAAKSINKNKDIELTHKDVKYDDLPDYDSLCNLIRERIKEDEDDKIKKLSNWRFYKNGAKGRYKLRRHIN